MELQQKVKFLEEQQTQQNKPLMSSLFASKTPDEQTSEKLLLHAFHRERCQINNIERNVIISGYYYVSDEADKTAVNETFAAIEMQSSEKKFEIRQIRTSQKAPANKILVTFRDIEDKQHVMQRANKLRKAGTKFTNIYLNEDRTNAQRVIDKELRDERNRRNNHRDFTEETYEVTINGQRVTQTRRVGEDDYGEWYYWAIRNEELKKIFIEKN